MREGAAYQKVDYQNGAFCYSGEQLCLRSWGKNLCIAGGSLTPLFRTLFSFLFFFFLSPSSTHRISTLVPFSLRLPLALPIRPSVYPRPSCVSLHILVASPPVLLHTPFPYPSGQIIRTLKSSPTLIDEHRTLEEGNERGRKIGTPEALTGRLQSSLRWV